MRLRAGLRHDIKKKKKKHRHWSQSLNPRLNYTRFETNGPTSLSLSVLKNNINKLLHWVAEVIISVQK